MLGTVEESMTPTVARHDGLRADAAEAVEGVRHAVRHLIGALPGRIGTAAALQRILGVDYNLCWHLFKILKPGEPLEAARHVPGEFALRKLAAAAEDKGVPADVVEMLRSATSRFDRTVLQHATDRSAFKAMVSSFAGDEAAEVVLLQQRRNAFKAESQLWGAQVGTVFTHISVTRTTGDKLEMVSLSAHRGFQRLRSEARPIVFGSMVTDSNASPLLAPSEPLDVEAFKALGAPLLPQFCTTPIPPLARVDSPENKWTYYVLETEELGRRGAVDLVKCQIFRQGTLTALKDGRKIFYSVTQPHTPVEQSIIEVAMHRPSMGTVSPGFRTIPAAGVNFLNEVSNPVPQMLSFEKVEALGTLDSAAAPNGVPHHRRMITHVYDRMGLNPAEFDLYRVSIAYPILHTKSTIIFDVS